MSVGAPDADLAAYEARLARKMRRVASLAFVALPASRAGTAQARRAEEGRRILRALDGPYALLDPEGDPLAPEALARWLRRRPARFVVGGPDGVDDAVRARAARRWRLGRPVLSHALARAVLVEQIFRAAMAAVGHPYPR